MDIRKCFTGGRRRQKFHLASLMKSTRFYPPAPRTGSRKDDLSEEMRDHLAKVSARRKKCIQASMKRAEEVAKGTLQRILKDAGLR